MTDVGRQLSRGMTSSSPWRQVDAQPGSGHTVMVTACSRAVEQCPRSRTAATLTRTPAPPLKPAARFELPGCAWPRRSTGGRKLAEVPLRERRKEPSPRRPPKRTRHRRIFFLRPALDHRTVPRSPSTWLSQQAGSTEPNGAASRDDHTTVRSTGMNALPADRRRAARPGQPTRGGYYTSGRNQQTRSRLPLPTLRSAASAPTPPDCSTCARVLGHRADRLHRHR